ncbi:MAG: hypothetical protein WD070_02935, partial [Pirellulaceae bacterium]
SRRSRAPWVEDPTARDTPKGFHNGSVIDRDPARVSFRKTPSGYVPVGCSQPRVRGEAATLGYGI